MTNGYSITKETTHLNEKYNLIFEVVELNPLFLKVRGAAYIEQRLSHSVFTFEPGITLSVLHT